MNTFNTMIFTCSEEEKILVKKGPDDSLTPYSFRNNFFFKYKYSHLHRHIEEKFDILQILCLHIQILKQKHSRSTTFHKKSINESLT